jgi:hypothetical protein
MPASFPNLLVFVPVFHDHFNLNIVASASVSNSIWKLILSFLTTRQLKYFANSSSNRQLGGVDDRFLNQLDALKIHREFPLIVIMTTSTQTKHNLLYDGNKRLILHTSILALVQNLRDNHKAVDTQFQIVDGTKLERPAWVNDRCISIHTEELSLCFS